MPLESEKLSQFPNSILGEYLEVYSNGFEIAGSFKTITEVEKGKYQVESQDVKFSDSLNWMFSSHDPSYVLKVNSKYLIISQNSQMAKIKLKDRLSSSAKILEFEIDLNQETYSDKSEEINRKCELKLLGGAYFLNLQYFNKYWFVTKIENRKDKMTLKMPNFSMNDEHKSSFSSLQSIYKFQSIKLTKESINEWNYFLLNADNEEMNSIFEDDFFPEAVWYKVNRSAGISKYLICGILLGIGFLLYILQRSIRKTT